MDNFIQIYLEYSNLFDKKLSKFEIKQVIQKWNGYPVAVLLSILSFYDMADDDLKKLFIKYLNEEYNKIELKSHNKYIERAIIASPQGLLSLWKLLLAYNKDYSDKITNFNIEYSVFALLLLTIAIHDHLEPHDMFGDNLKYYFLRNAYFNTTDNIKNAVARTWMIYFEEEINTNLKQNKEYVDYPNAFLNKYGYTINTYLAVLTAIMSFYETKEKGFDKPWLLNPDDYFKDTSISNIAKEIISSLSFTWSEGKSWSKEKLKNMWDFSLFFERPFLQVLNNRFIPISKKFLELQLFDSLFYKIRNCFSDLSFNSFFGRPFEVYSQWFMEKAILKSKLDYKYIKEFFYGKNSRRSPDIIVKLDNKVLVVEVKSKRPKIHGFISNNNSLIEESLNELIINPINQAINRMNDIIENNVYDSLSNENIYYFMTISISTMPFIAEYEDKINQLVNVNNNIKIAGIFHLDIEEFEYLCEIIGLEINNSVFNILDSKHNDYFYDCFKNFLIKCSLIPEKLNILGEIANKLFDSSMNILKI